VPLTSSNWESYKSGKSMEQLRELCGLYNQIL